MHDIYILEKRFWRFFWTPLGVGRQADVEAKCEQLNKGADHENSMGTSQTKQVGLCGHANE